MAAHCAATMLGEHSQRNSYMQNIMSLYLYASGASRQIISVLGRLGQTVSYVTVTGRGKKTLDAPIESEG
jgi:hypothetical protein